MNCFIHDRSPAVGLCAVCQKAVCRQCVGLDTPRLICRTCLESRTVMGFEYRSRTSLGGWPLIHVCMGIDPRTMRPRIAKGVVAIGNLAIGGVAIGGLACGLVTVGGASLGMVLALGGAAVGVGVAVGGLAVGSVAIGGAAIGFVYAIGGGALGPAIIDGRRCDPAALDFVRRWLGFVGLPPSCR
jgi:hypothetical protein